MTARRALPDAPTLVFFVVLLALTALRIQALRLSPIDLHFDEAQYWTWSRALEWGYFSKPPLVAWVIAATTALFDDSEWAVRLGAPLAHGLGAIALFLLGRRMYGAWSGFWSGVGWLLLPAVTFSSGLISTDAILLPLWAWALYALWRLTETRHWIWALLLGLSVGFGALAKYAMLYFPLCAALAAWWSLPVREAVRSRLGVIAGLTALIVLLPNLIWNLQHGFVTVSHTAANARLSEDDLFNPDELLQFVGDQIGLIGPIFFVVLGWLFWRGVRRNSEFSGEDKFLLAFVAPPLLIIMLQALFARANANWAAAAYPAAIVWLTGVLIATKNGRRWLAAATALNLAIGAGLATLALSPGLANQIGPIANGLKRSRGWEETAHEIALRAAPQPGEPPITAVLVDHRAAYFELAYYWRDARREGAPLPPVRMWLLHEDARNSAEQVDPMRPEEGARVLVVHSTPGYVPLVAGDFTTFRRVEHLTIPLGGGINRELEISIGEGFAPAPRDAAFEQRLRGED
jgi:hypothetical protein